MLLNDFFKIISSNNLNGFLNVVSEVDPKHKIFEGHFPGQPVVPGVCLIQSLKEIIEESEGRKFQLESAGNIKFLAVIDPNINRTINWEITLADMEHGLGVKCIAHWNEKVCFKFAGKFK